ncbi:MAG: Periplasmic pH-dependent serine endoprotease DegQ precursor [Verrucomicrobiota bacterium]|jgi:serine protease Do
MIRSAAAFCCLVLPLLAAEPAPLSLIETKDGARLEVRGVEKEGDTLNFQIAGQKMTLPMSSVSRFVSLDQAPDKFRLYHDADPKAETRPSKDLMDLHGAAVVTVKNSGGTGSGFFIHEDGYLLTNAHVIEGEHPESLTVCQFVKTADGIQEKAFAKVRIVAVAGRYDLALLKVEDGGKFPFVDIADSTVLKQGDAVFTIGSPLGLTRSISEGVVAQPQRYVEQGNNIYGFYIQMTAAISPGNSGGPLFNMKGQILGMNSMGASQGQNIGLAIPSDWIKTFLRNREAFAFEPSNPANGVRYLKP